MQTARCPNARMKERLMRKVLFALMMFIAPVAHGASDSEAPKQIHWSFDGVFGTVDRQSAQRGFQVYKEVCAACHSLRLNSYRNLNHIGFSEAEVKAIAAEASVIDGPDAEGEMFERPGRPSDRFASPFPNEQAARASNGGAMPVDLSLIVKARPDGANYLYSLLTGYHEAPAGVKIGAGMYYNPYFPGGQIAMPPPLADDLITYGDNSPATVHQMAYDVTNFLQWAAEPEMEQRKRMGIKVMLYLLVFTVLFVMAKRRVWSRLKE